MRGDIIQVRRNTSAQWASVNPILYAGQEGYETDTGRRKMGDGISRWTELDYFLSAKDIRNLVAEAKDEIAVTEAELAEHINSLTPHPAYDDVPSFLSRYRNAKV